MKKLIAYTTFFLFFQFSSIGQEKTSIPPQIKKAFVTGDSKLLANHFSQSIELLIKKDEDVYSKAQAELILKEFFRKNAPSKFIVEVEGESEGIKYAVGNLKTANGKYRIYLSYRKTKKQVSINRLSISNFN